MRNRLLFLTILMVVMLTGCLQNKAAIPPTTEALSTQTVTPTPAPTATERPLIPHKEPWLIMTGNPSSLKICWQFDPPADAALAWGTDNSFSSGAIAVAASQPGEISCATLTGLTNDVHYQYRLTSSGASFVSSFTAPPAPDSLDLVFWGYGDTQENPEVHDAIDAAILSEIGSDPSRQTFVFDAGDIMNNASEENLQANEFDPLLTHVVQLSSELPIVNIMGNHDGTRLFIKYYPYPYTDTFDWSFDYGPAHFVVIDLYSNTDTTSPRWQWLRDDLASSTKKWKFILLHEPGWSAGPHENNEVVQQIIHPIAVSRGVAIVFSGHNHYYARALVDGVNYITTGGGGGVLYDPEHDWPNVVKAVKAYHYLRVEISGTTLTLSALTPQGELLDQFQITK